MWRLKSRSFWSWLLGVLLLLTGISTGGSPVITEFMADNTSGLRDQDGDFSDWIEIYNPDQSRIDLLGFHLTDDSTHLRKWTFPAVTLSPGAYLIVFASGKNRTDPAAELHTDFQLAAEGEYLALIAPDGVTGVNAFGPSYPPQFENQSFGLAEPTASAAWSFFSTPTPGAANTNGTPAGPIVEALQKDPPQPVNGPLMVRVKVRPVNAPLRTVSVYYRLMFGAETILPMTLEPAEAGAMTGDRIWTATIPSAAFLPGQMTRWRFVAADEEGIQTKEPAFHAPKDSPQYLGTVAYDPSIRSALPVVHWFTSNPSAAGTLSGARGSMYYDGEFYDNVLFSLHGQSSSGFPKKSYNIDFNRGRHFRWSTNAPRVADIDLLSNWADKSKVRNVLAYEVMRLSGVAAHFAFTVRVQQNGRFFSTADFIEDADETYLERAGLNKDGALYKVYNNLLNKDGGDTGASGVEKKTRRFEKNDDLQALINGLDRTGAAWTNYFYDNIDIPRCVNMLAANSVIRNSDMHSKNWYIYCDTGRSGEWAILPWDLDLSQGRVWNTQNTYFDNALYTDGFVVNSTSIRLVAQLFANSSTRAMILRRIRTLTDRFLQPLPGSRTPESELYYERRLNEQLAAIDPPTIVPSDAQLDFEKWGSWLQGGATVRYTNSNPAVESMARALQRWKTEYLPGRRKYIYNTQIMGRGGEIPLPQSAAPALNLSGPPINFGKIEAVAASGNENQSFIQLLNTNAIAVDISDWKLSGAVDHTFAPGTVLPPKGALYVCPDAAAFRARTTSPKGGEGLFVQGGYQKRLSPLGGTLVLIDAAGLTNNLTTYPATPSDAQKYLAVSEIMYHPAGDGLAEFIELLNISRSVTLDLRNVRFTRGIDFDFSRSTDPLLGPGQRALLVRDLAAFTAVYGTNLPVIGVFANGTALNNAGETLRLEETDYGTILEFAYGTVAPWPVAAAGGGRSLVLIAPETHPDPALGLNWRASARPGGSPGEPDLGTPPADPTADTDHNGECDLIDFVLGNDLGGPVIAPKLSRQLDKLSGAATLQFSFPVSLSAQAVQLGISYSTDLMHWEDAAYFLELLSTDPLGDGRALLTYRIKPSLENSRCVFLRLRATVPASPGTPE